MSHNKLIYAAAAMLLCASCSENDSDFNLSDDSATPYEADIRRIYIDDQSILKVHSDTILDVYKSNIVIRSADDADLSNVVLRFKLTSGATIYAINGDQQYTPCDDLALDYTDGQSHTFMVQSQNNQSHKLYTIAFSSVGLPVEHIDGKAISSFHLESFALNSEIKVPHYYEWEERNEAGETLMTWCSANGGFGIAKSNSDAMDYPTYPCEGIEEGTYGVALTTRSTGAIAAMMNMRLAAGNFFIGDFNIVTALRAPRESTHFGVPHNYKPIKFSGYMSYQAGESYQDEDGNIIDYPDSCDIYTILYRNYDDEGNAYHLDGDNVGDSPYIVAKARIPAELRAGTDGVWTRFEIDYDYDYPLGFDQNVLDAYGYSLTIVASSSTDGAFFRGAPGSTLKIDELTIECEE